MRRRQVGLLLGVLVTLGARAGAIHVDVQNTAGVEDGTLAHPYNTIQEGINHAGMGDVVSVAAGIYHESVAMADGVSVIGAGARDTTIDGTGTQSSVVTFNQTNGTPELRGFTITGGEGDQIAVVNGIPVTVGGGIQILNSSPTIIDNVITGNRVTEGYCIGGAIYVSSQSSNPRIFGNVITGNEALSSTVPGDGRGGGLYVNAKNGSVSVAANLIQGNRAADGGGLHVRNELNGVLVFRRNTLQSNTAVAGGGISLNNGAGSTALIENNLVLENGSGEPGAFGGGIRASTSETGALSIVHNTFVGNGTASGAGGALWLEGPPAAAGTSLVANNIFASNSASKGGAIDHTSFSGTIRNNGFHANAGGDFYDAGAAGALLIDNLFADPQFAGPSFGNYRLAATSPFLDAAYESAAPPQDWAEFARPFDGDDDGTSASDLGAHEYPAGEVLDLHFGSGRTLTWRLPPIPAPFDLYRGSLSRLRTTGEYTQNPDEEPLAARFCGLAPTSLPFDDGYVPPRGPVVFYLVSSENGYLGTDSTGRVRPDANPCP